MPQTSYRDSQNPWFANQAPAAPAPGAGTLPPGAWQGLGPGISNLRGQDASLLKYLDPKNYQNWTRDQWRAAMSFGSHTADGQGIMNQLENLIGTHALNNHKNYFNSGGQGYLPGHWDSNTGQMNYGSIDPNLIQEVNNRNFAIQGGSYSGEAIGAGGQLGTHSQTGTINPNMVNIVPQGTITKPTATAGTAPPGFQTSNPASTGPTSSPGPATWTGPKSSSNGWQQPLNNQAGVSTTTPGVIGSLGKSGQNGMVGTHNSYFKKPFAFGSWN